MGVVTIDQKYVRVRGMNYSHVCLNLYFKLFAGWRLFSNEELIARGFEFSRSLKGICLLMDQLSRETILKIKRFG